MVDKQDLTKNGATSGWAVIHRECLWRLESGGSKSPVAWWTTPTARPLRRVVKQVPIKHDPER
jgi:hypothetical protein